MYTTLGGSLQRCASCITAEITNRGRTFIWDVLARALWGGTALSVSQGSRGSRLSPAMA
jgi:hypothetical protein